MQILFEIEHLSTKGGIERILTDKANYMADVWGWDVTIVVLLEEKTVTAYYLSPKVKVIYLHIQSMGMMMCLEALWKLNTTVKRIKPDIYVTFQTIGAMSCLFHTHRVPTVYEAHGIRTCMQHQFAMSMAERFADCVVVLTDKNAERYKKARKVMKIPNFTVLKSESAIDYSSKHCIALGRLDYEKNYSRLINIWTVIHQCHPDWVCDIYGEGPEYEILQELIDKLNLTETVILHGITDDPVAAYHSSSIFLMTSLFEGLPMTLIEATTCGLPCVAFDCDDGPREIIEDGKTGYLIPYDEDQTFVEKLSALMDDEALRQRMGETSKIASKRFQPASIMAQWLKLYTFLTK